jgi:hypothetical protein
MLVHDLQERAALRHFAERGDETSEALESFLLDHYATPHPHVDYLAQIVKNVFDRNVLAITGDYYFSLPREKRFSLLSCSRGNSDQYRSSDRPSSMNPRMLPVTPSNAACAYTCHTFDPRKRVTLKLDTGAIGSANLIGSLPLRLPE